MFILEVLPIAKFLGKDSLSYFSREYVHAGNLVVISVRSRKIKALVIACKSARELKGDLKSQSFGIKRIESDAFQTALPYPWMQALEHCTFMAGQKTGEMLRELIPQDYFENMHEAEKSAPLQADSVFEDKRKDLQITFAQELFQKRIQLYKEKITELKNKGGAIYIVAPHFMVMKKLWGIFSNHFPEDVVMYHSALSKKQRYQAIETMTSCNFSVCIGTVRGLVFNIPNVIIIENYGSRDYLHETAPFFDERKFILEYGKQSQAEIIIGDELLHFEFPSRTPSIQASQPTHVIKPQQNSTPASPSFQIFHNETIQEITASSKVLFVTSRKGLATMTVCEDCKTVLAHPQTGTPLVFHYQKDYTVLQKRHYIDPRTGESFPLISSCTYCGSHKLKLLGIGTETLDHELGKLFPTIPRIIVDGDHTKNIRERTSRITDWEEFSGPAFLIMTSKNILSLNKKFDLAVIPSLEQFLAIPQYDADVSFLRYVLQISEQSEKKVIIQTRLQHESLTQALQETPSSLQHWIDTSLQERKAFHYPPYYERYTISKEVPSNEEQGEFQKLSSLFTNFNPQLKTLPSLKKGHCMIQITCTFEASFPITSQQKKFLQIIEDLPMYYRITPFIL